MSQFRNKNIHLGLIDTWVFRVNDQGIIEGDDIVAEDPNELAQAISDTQELLLKTSVTAPGDLIDPNRGALERIKYLEDTVGNTSLQMAYDEGNIISITPGRELTFGASGDFILDSSRNLTINANTFKVKNSLSAMMIRPDGLISYDGDLKFETTFTNKNISLKTNNEMIFKDKHLSASITLSDDSTNPTLVTTSQSIVGAINEIANGFGSTSLQDVYDQSAAPQIQTDNSHGSIRFIEYLDSVPALIVDGTISCLRKIEAPRIEILDNLAVTAVIESNGAITSEEVIRSNLKLITPKLESVTGQLIITDGSGSVTLTESGETSLGTSKQSLFGSINEVNSRSLQNSSYLAVLDTEHDYATGRHDKITIKASSGHNSDIYFTIYDDVLAAKITMDAEGRIYAEEMSLNMYDVSSELAANKVHRLDDGTSHSAVNNHINTAVNPHNTVNTIKISGGAELRDDITFVGGAGVTLTQSGQEITIEASSGTTLQGVYDNQSTGELKVNTASGKDLTFKNSNDESILKFEENKAKVYKELSFESGVDKITGSGELEISAASALKIESVNNGVDISAPSSGQTVTIQSVDFTDGTSQSLHDGLSNNVIGALNDLANDTYITGTNETGVAQTKGTAVVLRENGSFWIPYSDINEDVARDTDNALANNPGGPATFWHVFGVLAEDISAGASGLIKISGTMTADVGTMGGVDWIRNDILYISKVGKSVIDIIAPQDGDWVEIDGKRFTAVSGSPTPNSGEFQITGTSNIELDGARNNLVTAINDEVYRAASPALYVQAFVAGETAKGRIDASSNCSSGETVTITPDAVMDGEEIILTAISSGSPTLTQFLVGQTKEETLLNLAEAINNTAFKGGSGGDGHRCYATAFGPYIEIKWMSPGASGNEVSMSTSSSAFSIIQMSGGTAKVEVYTSDRSASSKTINKSNASRLQIHSFSQDEGNSQYISSKQWFIKEHHLDPNERQLKIGKVIKYVAPFLTFSIDIEEPRRNKIIKGMPYDTQY